MNEQLQHFARQSIITGLSQLQEKHRVVFRKMYAGGKLDVPIVDVVIGIPDEKLDWAMEQVKRTIDKESAKKHAV